MADRKTERQRLERERRKQEAIERAQAKNPNERLTRQAEIDAILDSLPVYRNSSQTKNQDQNTAQGQKPVSGVSRNNERTTAQRSTNRRTSTKNKRRGKKKSRKMRPFMKAFFVIAFIFVLLVGIGLSPLCAIKNIRVSGNEKVTTEEIVSASALLPGQNLFTADFAAAKQNVYNLAWVSSVSIKRRIPSTITVTVTESEIAGYLLIDNMLVAIDDKAKSIHVADVAEGAPVFTGIISAGFETGQPVRAQNEDSLKAVLDYLEYFKRYRLLNVTSVDVTVPDDIIFTIEDRLIVHFGDDEGIAYKMAYLKETLKNLPEDASGVVDATRVDKLGKPDITYRPSVFEPTPAPTQEPVIENPYE